MGLVTRVQGVVVVDRVGCGWGCKEAEHMGHAEDRRWTQERQHGERGEYRRIKHDQQGLKCLCNNFCMGTKCSGTYEIRAAMPPSLPKQDAFEGPD